MCYCGVTVWTRKSLCEGKSKEPTVRIFHFIKNFGIHDISHNFMYELGEFSLEDFTNLEIEDTQISFRTSYENSTEKKLNRSNNLPAVICQDGTLRWYVDGVLKKQKFNNGTTVHYDNGKITVEK